MSVEVYFCKLATNKLALWLCFSVGTSTCGTSPGWPVQASRQVTVGGRLWIRPLKRLARVHTAAVPPPSPPSATDKSTWNSTLLLSLLKCVLHINYFLPSFVSDISYFAFLMWNIGPTTTQNIYFMAELVSLCISGEQWQNLLAEETWWKFKSG